MIKPGSPCAGRLDQFPSKAPASGSLAHPIIRSLEPPMKTILCCALISLVFTASVQAGDCCDDCGCDANCCKVCRLVPSTKKVTTPEYKCECEDFCVPGPSQRTVCHDECGRKKIVYTPTCAEVRTRKKLVKTENTKTVPTTKWVVENLCPKCAAHKADGPLSSDATADNRRGATNDGAVIAVAAVDGEAASGGTFRSRVQSDLARVLLSAGRKSNGKVQFDRALAVSFLSPPRRPETGRQPP